MFDINEIEAAIKNKKYFSNNLYNSEEKLIYDDNVFNGCRINAPEMKRSEQSNSLTMKKTILVNEHADYWIELLNSDDLNDNITFNIQRLTIDEC